MNFNTSSCNKNIDNNFHYLLLLLAVSTTSTALPLNCFWYESFAHPFHLKLLEPENDLFSLEKTIVLLGAGSDCRFEAVVDDLLHTAKATDEGQLANHQLLL